MSEHSGFHVVTIPLNRDEIVEFLNPPKPKPEGAKIRIVDLRPDARKEKRWSRQLREKPGLKTLLARDNPELLVTEKHTDRLIPAEFLKKDDEYLTRNLGGWSPVFFGVMQAEEQSWNSDPLLRHAVKLKTYGENVRYFGADPQQTASRISLECGAESPEMLAQSVIRLHDWREARQFDRDTNSMLSYAASLYEMLASGGELTKAGSSGPAVPSVVLTDELMGTMVRIEDQRRRYVAAGEIKQADAIKKWQEQQKEQHGLVLILKGEYIMGRHRCSTVLIAPELEIVAKQPGPEPFHEAKLGAVTHKGKPENHPVLTRDGALVTSAGRMRLIIEEGLIERLNRLFHHDVRVISSFGYIIEPFVTGPTLQEYVLEKSGRLTGEVYEFIMLHQQVCEQMGVENGDWHAANFIVEPGKPNPFAPGLPAMTHIDWGAARPLEKVELSKEQAETRINQVQNIAFSFHDQQLARISRDLHEALAADAGRMKRITEKAKKLVQDASP